MLVQVENTAKGYIVSIFLRDENGYGSWHRLVNFGEHQGDARLYMESIVPKYSEEKLKLAIKTYNEDKIYMIVNGNLRRAE